MVVRDADGVTDDTMLRFARETRLSETTFVQSATTDRADYRNRIFTMVGEVPFAGHPSLGTGVAPATGSAAGALCAYLAERAGTTRVEVSQGAEVKRPSRLIAELEGDRVRVGGDVVVVAEGQVTLP